MHEQHHFNFLEFLGVPAELTHVVMAAFVASALLVTMLVARLQLNRAMKTAQGALVPDTKLTYRNFFEIVAEGLYQLTESVMGHHEAARFFPVMGTLFIFIFVSNIIGLIPGLLPPTSDLNTTLALGLFVFLYYNFAGLRENGLGYLKHFWGPVFWLGPLMLVIEIASHVFRPLSLALRLRGNIDGDHVILGVFSGLAPIGVPIIFYGLGVFVAFIQALVFCLMTMVYISLSTAHDH